MNRFTRAPRYWVLVLGVTAACGARPEPAEESDTTRSSEELPAETSFASAERLRLAYDERASHQAIRGYREARDAWRRAGDRARAATASQGLGATYEQLGRLDDALRHYREAAATCEETCDTRLESAIASAMGTVQSRVADSETSLQAARLQCERALSLATASGDARQVVDALNCAGEVEYHSGNADEAVRLHRRAKLAYEDVPEAGARAITLFYLGTALSDVSRFAEADGCLQEALTLWTGSSDRRGEAMALVGLGRLEYRQGEYQEALNHFRQASDRLVGSGDVVWEASRLAGVGMVYFDMGDRAQALSYLGPAAERYARTGLSTATWDLLLAVGVTLLELDEPRSALPRFREALTLAETKEDDRGRVYALRFMSVAHRSLGEPPEAVDCLEQALALLPAVRDPRLEAAVQSELGKTREALGRRERATESFRRALELSESAGDRVGEAESLFELARIARNGHELDAARGYGERALAIVESLRTKVESRELRTSYLASTHRFFELYLDVLMRLDVLHPKEGFGASAFAVSERARARSFLESLAEAGVDPRAGVDPKLLEREQTAKRRLGASVSRWVRSRGAADGEATALDGEIRKLEAEHDLALAEIRAQSRQSLLLGREDPLDLDEVRERLLDADTLLLEYALGDERSFLWSVSRDGYASFELAPREEIEARAERLYALLTARAQTPGESLQARVRRVEAADEAYWAESARLSEELLGPVADRLVGKKIVVVLDGALQQIPFGALPIPGSVEGVPLLAQHEIVHLPSASTLAALRRVTSGRERPSGTLAVFADPVFEASDPRLSALRGRGDRKGPLLARDASPEEGRRDRPRLIPRLEGTRREAVAIAEAAPPGTSLKAIGFEASRGRAIGGELRRYRILHFATHAVSNGTHPSTSGVLLSMFDASGRPVDGFLRLDDIYDLDLSADLVVLSACDTALGKRMRGEGVLGLTRAFLYAGAARVIGTFWRVDDEATRELMGRFYREMLGAGRSPSEALRNAQLGVWRETRWRSPYFWAAFALQGEWRAPASAHDVRGTP